ncbi:tetratricopeptide repeat protein [Bacteroides sp.]|uniref:tetratricopeptide repeat protein n=1 Tax=Bacteroides sp. TaxID=29523 RepID=UPI003A934AD8
MNSRELSAYFKTIKQSVDDFDDPNQALSAVEAITPVAEQGNAQAQYWLGRYYYRFYCEDSSRFLCWMERAAEADNLKAIKFLADYYRYICDDMDLEQRKSLGRKWLYRMIEMLKKKADKGMVSAAKSLMSLYVHDRPDDMTEKEGLDAALAGYERLIEILRAKAERGTAKDKKNLADTLSFDWGVPVELASHIPDRTDEATRLYEEISGDKKDGVSYFDLAQTYSREGHEEKAFAYYMKAAEMDYATAYYNVAAAYYNGEGVERDFDKAFEWFKKAADSGDSYAKLKLAECYKRGAGCKKDYAAAMALYQQIADSKSRKKGVGDNDMAEYELGNMYLKGLGVEVDLQKAYGYFKRAASHYNRAAENALNNKKFRDFK